MYHCEYCNCDFEISPYQFGAHKRNCSLACANGRICSEEQKKRK